MTRLLTSNDFFCARIRRPLIAVSFATTLVLLGLFVANGTSGSWRDADLVSDPRAERPPSDEIVVVAWNLAKLGFHRGGVHFAPAHTIETLLDAMAEELVRVNADIVFLSEVVAECGPRDIDQVEGLARRAGFPHYAFAENYSFGIPSFRIRSGNAILSRWPLGMLEVQQLPGERPFWSPTGNRRVLWATVAMPTGDLRVASVRNDSFDLENNALQVREILSRLESRGPALLAGDFNAEPEDESMRLFAESGLFVSGFDGDLTFPASSPLRRIDSVLVPEGWEVVDERVPLVDLSDHRPVVVHLRHARDVNAGAR